jgi:hypothetical protein
MSLPGCCGPDINANIIIHFYLLHNQGGRFKIVSTIGHVLCVLLFMNESMPYVLIAILIFLRCLIIPTSYLCFSLCHRNNSDSFANQCFKPKMIEKYQNTFLGPLFLLLQFSSSLTSFLTIESVESTNRAFLKVFILRPTI